MLMEIKNLKYKSALHLIDTTFYNRNYAYFLNALFVQAKDLVKLYKSWVFIGHRY